MNRMTPITISPGATLAGTGSVGNISGEGTVSPGLSPGILTAVVLNRVDYRGHARRAYGDQLHHYGAYESYFGVGAQSANRS